MSSILKIMSELIGILINYILFGCQKMGEGELDIFLRFHYLNDA